MNFSYALLSFSDHCLIRNCFIFQLDEVLPKVLTVKYYLS
jgi:hypothetical protein